MTSAQAPLCNFANATLHDFTILFCIGDTESLILTAIYASLNILMLPLYILVLLTGLRQWQQQQGALSSIATSDILTNNLALIEIVGSVSSVVFSCGSWAKSMPALASSFCLFVMYFFGEALFHCGICVDKYLAVVHPITYRNLKESRAVLVRNIVIVFGWLIVFIWIPPVQIFFPDFPAKEILISIVLLTVMVLYCCVASLLVLIRPGPSGKKQVDKSKRKAFHIILIITVLLFLKMVAVAVYLCFYIFRPFETHRLCLTLIASVIVIVPVNGLIPLLYVRRMKRMCR